MRRLPCTFLLLVLPSGCGDNPPPPVRAGSDVQQLCRRLDRLLDAFERTTSSPPAEGAPSPHVGEAAAIATERVAAGDDPAVLRRRIAALEAEVAQLREQALAASARGAEGAAAGSWPGALAAAPIRSDAVRDFITRNRDARAERRDDTFREVLLKSPAQILARFGTPTESYVTKNGSLLWEYVVGDDHTTFSFANGQLVTVW